MALNRAFDRQTIDDLLFLHKMHNSGSLESSADGVLKFSRLMAAGLATFFLDGRLNLLRFPDLPSPPPVGARP